MKIFNKKIEFIKKHKINSLFLVIILTTIVLLFPNLVYADSWVKEKLLFGLTWVVYGIVYFLGLISLLVLHFLGQVAQYNGFIKADTVVKGWEIVRDLCNMFFVLILLIIAFATILKKEDYSAKKLLPKLLIMAVLINFSKTICGLFIDFAQVIMLTFVNSFAGGGINNLTNLLGMDKLLDLASNQKDAGEITIGAFAGVLGAFFAALITFIVIVTMLAVLVVRIMMLWVYVILSPIAFLGFAFPGQKFSSQWWSEFSKNVVVGPILAFFLWLALSTAQSSSKGLGINVGKGGQLTKYKSDLMTGIFEDDIFQTYMVTIALLVGGLMVAQQMGGAVGSIAGKGMAAVKKVGASGIGVVKRVTGIDYVSGVAEQYMTMRKAERKKKFQRGAEALSGKIGETKEKYIAKPYTAISNKTLGKWGHKATNLKTEARKEQEELDVDEDRLEKFKNREDIKNKGKFREGNFQYSWNKETKKWGRLKIEKTDKIHEDGEVIDKDGNTVNKDGKVIRKTKSLSDTEMERRFTKTSEKDLKKKKNSIKQKLDEAEEAEKTQKKVDKGIKIGLGVVGAGAGAGVGISAGGGLGIIPALVGGGVGAVYGAFGVPDVSKQIKEAGKTDLNLASNYKSGQIQEHRERLKTEDNEKIKDVRISSTDPYEKVAATMEELSRGMLSLEQAIKAQEEIKESMGEDKRVMGQVNMLLEKNNPGAVKPFKDLKSSDATTQQKAHKEIRDKYENGTYTMKELDVGTLKNSIRQLAEGLKIASFKEQYKKLSDKKKETIKIELKKDGSVVAKEKLASITDIDNAYGDEDVAGKKEFVKKLDAEDLKEIFMKKPEQLDAIKKLKLDKKDLSSTAQTHIEMGSTIGRLIKNAFNITNKEKEEKEKKEKEEKEKKEKEEKEKKEKEEKEKKEKEEKEKKEKEDSLYNPGFDY